MMQTHQYRLVFNTPAFLGNASQQAQWRTPPIKALLRQWWRIAYAARHDFRIDLRAMRHEEGMLFGHAWLEADGPAARKSKIRLRLSHWDTGRLREWSGTPKVTHPEVKTAVGSDLYLGYGPLIFNKGTALKSNAAIQAGGCARLSIAFPDDHADLLLTALCLMNDFGTLGGRSRNGWGSFHLIPEEQTPSLHGSLPLRDWEAALQLDWPHAIGQDSHGALIWQTRPHQDWKGLMKELAEIKIGLRTQFGFKTGKNALQPEARHWLSYPVTNHSVRPWGNNARLPNSLRFKIRSLAAQPEQLVGVIVHLPCLPPPSFGPNSPAIKAVWQQVHAYLNASNKLTRISA
jgi:CRISPR-associated protein Cmr1